MSKLKAWILWLLSSICFFLGGIINLINKNFSLGIMFLFIGVLYFVLSIIYYKKNKEL
jgi:uncharacterized protein (DUF58 family)